MEDFTGELVTEKLLFEGLKEVGDLKNKLHRILEK